MQTLIRQMQEMWLFGRLNTLEDSKTNTEVDGTAREVAELVQKLTAEISNGEQANGDGMEVAK